MYYQGGPFENFTHVTVPVTQLIAESEYNVACTAVMELAHFRMLIHELLNKNPYIFPKEASLIIFNSRSAACIANNGEDTKDIGPALSTRGNLAHARFHGAGSPRTMSTATCPIRLKTVCCRRETMFSKW